MRSDYRSSDKLDGLLAFITGGDSGFGRLVAVYFAKEGADVIVSYLNEDRDAHFVKDLVEQEGRRVASVQPSRHFGQ